MTEIEQAYKTLGLDSRASLRQVDEAYRDLRALWDPERLSANPRLRAQAREKKQEIEAAYERIIEHLTLTSRKKAPRSPVADQNNESNSDSNIDRPSTNLFEDAFSDRVSGGRRKAPVWALTSLIIFIVLLLGYLVLIPSQEEAEAVSEPAGNEEESELTKVVERVRGRFNKSSAPLDAPPGQAPQEAKPPAREKPKATPPKPTPKIAESKAARETSPPGQQTVSDKPPLTSGPKEQPESPPMDKPFLLRDEISTDGEVTSQPPDDGPSGEELGVFKALLRSSATASKLVKGEIGTLTFIEWSVIQQTTSETWIDLVATWTSGQEVHFFWAVNPNTGAVRPLNQAAQNLESSMQ